MPPIELVAASLLSAIAIIVSLWNAKRQGEWQERVLALEEAEERRQTAAEQSAKLRAVLDRSGRSSALLVMNDGVAEARDISIKIDGIPIAQHHNVLSGEQEVRQLGPGGSARYMLALISGTPPLIQVEIGWADGAGEAQRWRSDLSLF